MSKQNITGKVDILQSSTHHRKQTRKLKIPDSCQENLQKIILYIKQIHKNLTILGHVTAKK